MNCLSSLSIVFKLHTLSFDLNSIIEHIYEKSKSKRKLNWENLADRDDGVGKSTIGKIWPKSSNINL